MGNTQPILYHSTNDHSRKVDFATALLEGQPRDYGLYTIGRESIPRISRSTIRDMGQRNMSYAEIAQYVLYPFLKSEMSGPQLEKLLKDAYNKGVIQTDVQHVGDNTHIMWLTKGPTYSFKDYAARFFGRALDYILNERGLRRTVLVATSGDTGGAVADALHGLENVETIAFYPKRAVSAGQRRQMTTLGGNVYAFEVNGDFDVCQALAKRLLNDKEFAMEVYGDKDYFTSANSISVGRLLPQMVFPFYAYSRMANGSDAPMVASIPSGNFGDMTGTLFAREMGLPISKIVCGVNENTEFPEFLRTGEYIVRPTMKSPSSAMNVSHPSNLARVVDLYGGYMHDKRKEGRVIREGAIHRTPDMDGMRKDIFSVSISNPNHAVIMKAVYGKHDIILDPHGAVGWGALERFREQHNDKRDVPAVVYETADPGKFPDEVERAIGIRPQVPKKMQEQAALEERIFFIESRSDVGQDGALRLSDAQLYEAKDKIRALRN